MKKKLLILSACIGLVLACFPFTLFAEEDPESDLGFTPSVQGNIVSEYFYENYNILPYIESGNGQYINLGYSIASDQSYILRFSFLGDGTEQKYILGSQASWSDDKLHVRYYINNDTTITFSLDQGAQSYDVVLSPYSVYELKYNDYNYLINNQLLTHFNETDFNNNKNFYLFAMNNGSNAASGISYLRVYGFSVYDNEGVLIHNYYPAQVKSSGVIGLFDSVTNTFVTSANANAFTLPDGDPTTLSISAFISSFVTSGLSWIGDILGFAITEPMLIMFMAIGLAGAMFRWGRRLVHF